MPCYSPLEAYRALQANPSGKFPLVFKPDGAYQPQRLQVPCGKCIGCRLERSRQWALRCVHEAQLHEENCFLTLTYDDEHLPSGQTLVKHHHQDFMKRLRARIQPKRVRFFHCGEYGDLNDRPHYHTLLFGHEFADKELYSQGSSGSEGGNRLYTSRTLSRLWGHGFASIGALTFDSAAYVARYCLKKINGDRADSHYWACDPRTGELHQITPEYSTMSRNPGIAADWFAKFQNDVYPSDDVVLNGQRMKPAKFYDYLLEKEDPELLAEIKKARKKYARTHQDDQTRERLAVREKVKRAQTKTLSRKV